MKRIVIAAIGVLLVSLMGWTPANAASCPSSKVGGKTIGHVKVGNSKTPLKSVTYRRGGALDPPATNRAAGLSKRSAKIGAKRGTTVITWHVRYGKGCNGTLNSVLKKKIGSTFTVQKAGAEPITYRITKKVTVPKGGHKRAWFRRTGAPRVVLITCADLRGGVFVSTQAVIAVPVPPEELNPPPATPPTDPAATGTTGA